MAVSLWPSAMTFQEGVLRLWQQNSQVCQQTRLLWVLHVTAGFIAVKMLYPRDNATLVTAVNNIYTSALPVSLRLSVRY